MSGRLLQLNFNFNVTGTEYHAAVSALADDFAALDGLIWKVWMINEEEGVAGGIYLFDSESSVQAYLDGPLAAGVISHPALSEFSVKQFDVMDAVTAVTRGPV
jgi:hypothetical protein